MQKVVIGLLGVVIIGGGAWLLMRDGGVTSGDADGAAASAEQQSTGEPFAGEGSFADLAERGGAWQCSVSANGPTTDSTGTVYISGERIRGNFTSQVPQLGTVEAYMISDGTWVHSWSNMMPQGYRMPVAEAEGSASTGGATSGSQAFDYDQTVQWDCQSWTVDETMFELPSDVTFQTIQA